MSLGPHVAGEPGREARFILPLAGDVVEGEDLAELLDQGEDLAELLDQGEDLAELLDQGEDLAGDRRHRHTRPPAHLTTFADIITRVLSGTWAHRSSPRARRPGRMPTLPAGVYDHG